MIQHTLWSLMKEAGNLQIIPWSNITLSSSGFGQLTGVLEQLHEVFHHTLCSRQSKMVKCWSVGWGGDIFQLPAQPLLAVACHCQGPLCVCACAWNLRCGSSFALSSSVLRRALRLLSFLFGAGWLALVAVHSLAFAPRHAGYSRSLAWAVQAAHECASARGWRGTWEVSSCFFHSISCHLEPPSVNHNLRRRAWVARIPQLFHSPCHAGDLPHSCRPPFVLSLET